MRNRLNKALNLQNIKKTNSIIKYLGCNINYLKEYLQQKFQLGMSWNNYGEWHVDHIKPCSAFDLFNEEEREKCFHYTNLQPLWAIDNLIKSDKY